MDGKMTHTLRAELASAGYGVRPTLCFAAYNQIEETGKKAPANIADEATENEIT